MAGDDASPPPPPPRIDITSPYYLGPQDRPGDFITPTRLRGDNYDEWAGDIQTALEARRKFGFLDGTINAPTPPCTQTDWTTLHAMLISWLTNTIDPEVKRTLSKYRDAKRLWDTLKSRFALVNGPRIQQLKSSIAKCEQSKDMPVATYFGKLTTLWEELNNHEPLITCSCCTKCTAGIDHERRRETTRLHEFLMGLYTGYYAHLRTSILSQDPLPSLDRAYQLVTQDEHVRIAKAVSEEKPPDVVGFAIRTGIGRGKDTRSDGTKDKLDKSLLSCTHCKKSGHIASSCFELIGYPEWWPNQSKVNGGGAGRGKSSHNSNRGHGVAKAHATMANVAGPSSVAASSSQVFSAEQWKALAGFIGNTKIPDDRLHGKFDNRQWIVDTGASRHVTCDDTWLFDTQHVSYCPVGLPNGKTVMATKEGSVRLSNNITLKNVLFVPELSCNLISVSQMIDDMQCTLTLICVLYRTSRGS